MNETIQYVVKHAGIFGLAMLVLLVLIRAIRFSKQSADQSYNIINKVLNILVKFHKIVDENCINFGTKLRF